MTKSTNTIDVSDANWRQPHSPINTGVLNDVARAQGKYVDVEIHDASTCDDGQHNGNEDGADCGGPCGPCGTYALSLKLPAGKVTLSPDALLCTGKGPDGNVTLDYVEVGAIVAGSGKHDVVSRLIQTVLVSFIIHGRFL